MKTLRSGINFRTMYQTVRTKAHDSCTQPQNVRLSEQLTRDTVRGIGTSQLHVLLRNYRRHQPSCKRLTQNKCSVVFNN